MEKGQLISIIVPVYNVEEYVERCIRSIMNQTYPRLEIIIVDDGSVDSSGGICDRLGAEDKRIKVIHQDNRGLVGARKKGLEAAEGALIGFVDGDDYIEPCMYERLCCLLTLHDADIVHSGYFNNDTHRMEGVGKGGNFHVTEENRVSLLQKILHGRDNDLLITPSIWSKLFKRDLLVESYSEVSDSSSFGEDLCCLCGCFMKDIHFFVAEEAYYHYTLRDRSLSHDGGIAMMAKFGCLHSALQEMFSRFGVWDRMKDSVDGYFLDRITAVLSKRRKGSLKSFIQVYQYSDIGQLFGKRVVLYGAGSVGCDYYTQLRKYMKCELVAWVDGRYGDYECDYCELADPRTIPDLKYDVVLIGVMDRQSAEEIRAFLLRLGVPEEKICWKCPERIRFIDEIWMM